MEDLVCVLSVCLLSTSSPSLYVSDICHPPYIPLDLSPHFYRVTVMHCVGFAGVPRCSGLDVEYGRENRSVIGPSFDLIADLKRQETVTGHGDARAPCIMKPHASFSTAATATPDWII